MSVHKTALTLYTLIIIILVFWLPPITPSLGDQLDQIISSKSYQHLEANIKRSKRRSNKEKKKRVATEYESIFQNGKRGISKILSWLGDGSYLFKPLKPECRNHGGYISITRPFILKENKHKLTLKILLPAPKSMEAYKLGLFSEFKETVPSKKKSAYTEKIKIRAFNAQIYYKTDGACDLIMNMDKGLLLSLTSKTCEDRDMLIKLVSSLELEHLQRKLNT